MSARLRGATQVEDGWQEVPDEWLKDGAEEDDGASASEHDEDVEMGVNSEAKPDLDPEPETEPDEDMDAQLGKTGLESDDDAVSELTELSEITPPATVVATRPTSRQNSKKSGSSRKKPSQSRGRTLTIEASLPEDEIEPEWRPPDDFIEWETICVTLCEWEHICERFQGATHYAERALYKVLSQEIVPAITAELREIQRKRHLEEAVSHRKRSSRLAVKENEKEEARQAAMKRAEEEEKLSRARRLEARQKREEEERLKREVAREKRRLDREERERRAQIGAEQQWVIFFGVILQNH
jgi:flagellar biosynthesis GTPase FlhF